MIPYIVYMYVCVYIYISVLQGCTKTVILGIHNYNFTVFKMIFIYYQLK